MALKDLKKIAFSTDLLKFQDYIIEWISQLNKTTLQGIVVKNVVINATTTDIQHGLGRAYQGWHLLDIQGDARVWRDPASVSDSSKFLPLRASATVTVSLWVF